VRAASAERIWEACNEKIAGPDFGARALLRRMRVKAVCTTDDPADSLEHHASYAAYRASASARPGEPIMVPAFRPDKALAIESPLAWKEYLPRLGAAAGVEIVSYAPSSRPSRSGMPSFTKMGCRLSDHALVQAPGRPVAERRALFERAFGGPGLR
jgi:glucuronate isomerase